MNILTKYTLRCLKKNRVRTLVTIIGIILSVSLFTAVSEGAFSGQQYLIEVTKAETGAFHGVYTEVSDRELEELRALPEVDGTATLDGVGWAVVNEDSFYPYLKISSMSDGLTDLLSVRIISGRMPENSREILISDRAAPSTGADLQIGQTLTLEVGQRIGADGQPMKENDPYLQDGESLTETREVSYTIVGMYHRFPSTVESYELPGSLALTVGETGTTHTAFFTLHDVEDTNEFVAAHSFGSKGDVNRDLLLYSGASGNRNVVQVLNGLETILFALIAFGSVALIYNSFSISVSERTKQFGLLKSIGATKAQIRHAVISEALLLCVVAIPLGLMLGCAGIGLTLRFLRPAFSRIITMEGAETVPIRLVLNVPALALAAGIGLVTALVSAWIPAQRAVRIMPIQAIRQSNDVKVSKKEVRVSPVTRKLFGFPGMLASKNFKRSKKQYRSTVISLFMSIVLFISAMSFASYLRQDVAGSANESASDLVVQFAPDETDDWDALLSELSLTEGISDGIYAVNCSYQADIPVAALTESAAKQMYPENGMVHPYADIYFVNDAYYEQLCRELGMDPSAGQAVAFVREHGFENSPTGTVYITFDLIRRDVLPLEITISGIYPVPGYELIDQVWSGEEQRIVEYVYYPREGPLDGDGNWKEELILRLTPEEAERRQPLTIGGILDEAPMVSWHEAFTLVYPFSRAEEIAGRKDPSETLFYFNAENHVAAANAMKEKLEELGCQTNASVYDTRAGKESTMAVLLVLNVFTFGFITLISLIAAANVFNTISTNISLRRREFATLKSVGMEKKGFDRMMRFECLLYGWKALAWGLPVSVGVTYLIHLSVNNAFRSESFHLPWTAIGIAVGSVFLVVGATMVYAMHKINKENIVETLRNENI